MALGAGLTIGVDATTWWNRRGFGRFTRGQLGAMLAEPRDHKFILFVDQEPAEEMLRPHVEVVQVQTTAKVTEAAVASGSRKIGDVLAFRRATFGRRMDIFWFPAVYSWYPINPAVPSVITFHDAIAERFTGLVLPELRGRLNWHLKVWLAKRTARHIASVSNAARDEIVRYLGIPEPKITAILEAADSRFQPVDSPQQRQAARKELGLPLDRRLIVYVGGLAPHKNLAGLIRGYAAAVANARELDDIDLVLGGDPKGDGFHSNVEQLHEIARNAGLSARVHFPGFIPDSILPALYSDALAVAMPAFSEGFGLPAAEAIACGTPVIATAGGAVAEVVQEAGLFFDPNDAADIARVISLVARDKAALDRLKAECLPRAAELSWARSGAQMLDLLESCARR